MTLMSRNAGEPRRPAPVTAAPLPEAIGDEQCDRCSALARHRVHVKIRMEQGTFQLGHLMFCAHHYDLYLPTMIAMGIVLA